MAEHRWRVYRWDPALKAAPIREGEVTAGTAEGALVRGKELVKSLDRCHVYVIPLHTSIWPKDG